MDTPRRIMTAALTVCALVFMTGGVGGQGSGWPQWGGPTRDFRAPAARLAVAWPAAGPRQLWSRDLGEGYSSIAEDGGTLYTMHRRTSSDQEVVVALDASTGRTLWEHAYQARFLPKMDMQYGPGPHATPLVLGGLVYAVGVTGRLHALDKKTGRVVWSHDLYHEFGGKVMDRGYSCSPIAYAGAILLTVGGSAKSVVAFDQKDGRVVWSNGSFDPAPASPVLINVDGQEQLVFFHADGIAGIDPKGGAPLWDHPHRTNWGLNISTPVWGEGNLLFCSSAYSGGSRVLQLSQSGGRTTAKELWFSNRMRIHFGTAILLGDHVYGSSGDFGPAFFTAIHVRTGQVAWQDRALARSSFVYADGRLVILDEDGTLALASVSPQGLTIHSKAQILSRLSWTAPTLVATKLYIRDRATIKAFDLG